MKKVQLETPMTYAGRNYEAGLVDMAEDAAKSAVKRKFGKYADDDGNQIVDVPKGFKPLPFEETMERLDEGDGADEVFNSLKFYQPKIKAARAAGMSPQAFLEKEAADQAVADEKAKSSSDKGKGSESGNAPALSEDLPMRHVFARLGADYDSDEKIKALSREDLIAVNGIAEGSADKILAYFAEK